METVLRKHVTKTSHLCRLDAERFLHKAAEIWTTLPSPALQLQPRTELRREAAHPHVSLEPHSHWALTTRPSNVICPPGTPFSFYHRAISQIGKCFRPWLQLKRREAGARRGKKESAASQLFHFLCARHNECIKGLGLDLFYICLIMNKSPVKVRTNKVSVTLAVVFRTFPGIYSQSLTVVFKFRENSLCKVDFRLSKEFSCWAACLATISLFKQI